MLFASQHSLIIKFFKVSLCYNILISLSTVVLNSRDRHKKHGVPLLRASITCLTIYILHPEKLTKMH